MTLPVSVCDEIVAPPWEDMSPEDPRRRFSRHLLYDLTRPEKSPLLLAALAKEAGGLALCQRNEQNTAPVAAIFKDTADPDYGTIHAAITEAKKKLDEIKRFDMPGFRPRSEWVREMKPLASCRRSFRTTIQSTSMPSSDVTGNPCGRGRRRLVRRR